MDANFEAFINYMKRFGFNTFNPHGSIEDNEIIRLSGLMQQAGYNGYDWRNPESFKPNYSLIISNNDEKIIGIKVTWGNDAFYMHYHAGHFKGNTIKFRCKNRTIANCPACLHINKNGYVTKMDHHHSNRCIN